MGGFKQVTQQEARLAEAQATLVRLLGRKDRNGRSILFTDQTVLKPNDSSNTQLLNDAQLLFHQLSRAGFTGKVKISGAEYDFSSFAVFSKRPSPGKKVAGFESAAGALLGFLNQSFNLAYTGIQDDISAGTLRKQALQAALSFVKAAIANKVLLPVPAEQAVKLPKPPVEVPAPGSPKLAAVPTPLTSAQKIELTHTGDGHGRPGYIATSGWVDALLFKLQEKYPHNKEVKGFGSENEDMIRSAAAANAQENAADRMPAGPAKGTEFSRLKNTWEGLEKNMADLYARMKGFLPKELAGLIGVAQGEVTRIDALDLSGQPKAKKRVEEAMNAPPLNLRENVDLLPGLKASLPDTAHDKLLDAIGRTETLIKELKELPGELDTGRFRIEKIEPTFTPVPAIATVLIPVSQAFQGTRPTFDIRITCAPLPEEVKTHVHVYEILEMKDSYVRYAILKETNEGEVYVLLPVPPKKDPKDKQRADPEIAYNDKLANPEKVQNTAKLEGGKVFMFFNSEGKIVDAQRDAYDAKGQRREGIEKREVTTYRQIFVDAKGREVRQKEALLPGGHLKKGYSLNYEMGLVRGMPHYIERIENGKQALEHVVSPDPVRHPEELLLRIGVHKNVEFDQGDVGKLSRFLLSAGSGGVFR